MIFVINVYCDKEDEAIFCERAYKILFKDGEKLILNDDMEILLNPFIKTEFSDERS